jgi:hypothetical protein
MKKKTFNIGEYCLHGTIIAELRDLILTIKVCDYKTKTVRDEASFHINHEWRKLDFHLTSFTTSYYADKIVNHFTN